MPYSGGYIWLRCTRLTHCKYALTPVPKSHLCMYIVAAVCDADAPTRQNRTRVVGLEWGQLNIYVALLKL